MYIYLIKLEQKKYYVVASKNKYNDIYSFRKLKKDITWLVLYKPVSIHDMIKSEDDCNIDTFVYKYMKRFGVSNVRGGTMENLTLTQPQIRD